MAITFLGEREYTMDIVVDPLSTTPIFMQIHNRIIELICQDRLRDGDELDSVRTMARLTGVNPATVKKAYDLLVSEGLAVTLPRSGTVIQLPSRASALVVRQVSQDIENLVALATCRGVSLEQIRQATADAIKKYG